jgi:hypothetical protein
MGKKRWLTPAPNSKIKGRHEKSNYAIETGVGISEQRVLTGNQNIKRG